MAKNSKTQQITVADIVAKRKQRWAERHDLDYDRELIRASAEKILSTPSLRAEIEERPYLLIECCFYIVHKKRETVPFFFNEVQTDFLRQLEERGTRKPYFILKGRQQGFTSLITAIQLSFSIVRKNFAGMTIADKSSNSQAIFNDKARTVHARLPDILKPREKFNSRNEIFFDKLNSSWRIDTATEHVARSRTLNFVHFSEAAFYQCSLSDLQAAIGPAITDGAIQVYETTANGFNEAKDLWDSGSCHNLFYPWWLTSEYRSTEYEYLEKKDAWLTERCRVLEELGLDREQITWYCKTYHGYIDKSKIRQEFPCTPEEAFVASGECVFDKEILANRLASLPRENALKVGYFEYKKECLPIYHDGVQVDVEWKIRDIQWQDAADGYIAIHEEPRVKRDRWGEITHKAPYVIGGDTAGSGEDYFTAKVICNLDGHTVATLRRQRIDEDLYAEQIYCLGMYYREAMIGIEINYSRQPMRVLQQKYRYPNLFLRKTVHGMADRPEMEYGFLTNSSTKPIIIADLVELMRDDPLIECDRETLREMLTFVKKDNGRQEAIDGAHDDLVMALAIGHFVSKSHTHTWIEAGQSDDDFIERNFGTGHFLQRSTGAAEYMSWDDF